MFIVSLTYKKSIEEVEKYIPEHIVFLDKYYEKKKFVFSGRKNPRTGGVILVNNVTRYELEEIILEDPFRKYDIADYEITEVLPTRYDKRFECFLEA